MSVAPHYRLDVRAWVLGAVAIVTLVNLIEFSAIEARANRRYKVFGNYANADLLDIGEKNSRTFRHRYASALALRRLAPGSTLIVPQEGRYPSRELQSQMLVFGKVEQIRRVDYDPSTWLTDLDVKSNVMARTPKGKRPKYLKRKFVVLARSAPGRSKKAKHRTQAREFLLLKRGDLDVFVDTALIAKELKALRP